MRDPSSTPGLADDSDAGHGSDPRRHDRQPVEAPIGFHVTFRLADDRPLATTPAECRTIARVVLEQGESRGLVGFGAADDHLHAELIATRTAAGAFTRYVETALVWRLGLGARFEPARIRALQDQRHAYNTFHYVHRQDVRHAIATDPAREATTLPDLLGLRFLPTSIVRRVRAHLPRVTRADLAAAFPPGALDEEATVALDVLADAAAAVFALADLRGQCRVSTRARRAAVHAAPDAPTGHLAEALGVGTRAIQLARAEPAELAIVRAVRIQAALRSPPKRGG